MLVKNLILILLFLQFPSCSILEGMDQNQDGYIYNEWASVEKVEIVSNERGKLSLDVSLIIPTPCNEFQSREVKQVGDTVYVKYFSKIKKNIICVEILGKIKVRDQYNFEPGKNILFKFWRLEGTYLDTLIKIN